MASPASPRTRRAARAAAAAIDLALSVILALLLSSTLGMFFARRAVVALRIGQPGTFWQGPVPMLLGAIGEVTYLLPFTICVSWVLNPLTGATVGERWLRLRVVRADGRQAAPRQRWARTLLLTSGAWGWVLALLVGRWELIVAATIAGVVMLAGLVLMVGPRGRALHDRIAGTRMI